MKTLRKAAAMATLIAASVSASPATAMDWGGIADAYGHWTVSTLNTSLLNQSLSNDGPRQRPSWPGIDERNIQSTVFTPELLRQMVDSDLARTRQLLVDRVITVEGMAKPAGKADFMVSLDPLDTGAPGIITQIDLRQSGLTHPNARMKARYAARVQRIQGTSIVSLREARAATNTAPITPASLSAPRHRAIQQNTLTRANPAGLQFKRSSSVSRELNEHLATQLAPALSAGYTRLDILKLLNAGSLHKAYLEVTTRKGLQDTNLGDVMAACLILNWQIIHGNVDDIAVGTVRTVRDNARDGLARQSVFSQLDDTQKQRVADTFITGTMLNALRYQNARTTNDRQSMTLAQRDARQLVQEFIKVDLAEVALTAQGFR